MSLNLLNSAPANAVRGFANSAADCRDQFDDIDPDFRPRVLFVSSSKGNGGADRHAVELAVGLQARGAVMLFACRKDEFTRELCANSGIETTPFNLSNGSDVAAVRRLTQIIREHEIEIVHVHARRDFLTAALAVVAARRRRVGALRLPRLIFHLHLIRTIGAPLRLSGKFFQATVDAIICVSDTVATFIKTAHCVDNSIVRTIYNGVEIERYRVPGSQEASERRRVSRAKWQVPDEAIVIGMIGRLGQKGQANLLAVARRLVCRFPNLYFVFVGPERDPGDRDRILHWAEKQHISGHLIVPGACETIPASMAGFDVLAHLPIDEAFGLVLVEAMASGVPVVASAIGGCLEVVSDGETGFLVPLGNQAKLIAAVAPLLDPTTGPALRARIGAAGRIAAERFSRRVQLDNLLALYSELCGSAELSAGR